jgi:hypothetical protein
VAINEQELKEAIKNKKRLFLMESDQVFIPVSTGIWHGVKVVEFEQHKDESITKRVFDLTLVQKKFHKNDVNF